MTDSESVTQELGQISSEMESTRRRLIEMIENAEQQRNTNVVPIASLLSQTLMNVQLAERAMFLSQDLGGLIQSYKLEIYELPKSKRAPHIAVLTTFLQSVEVHGNPN